MPHEFRLPDLGEGLTEADIVHWHVSVGDTVAVDDPVVEIETAKTAAEITATHAGTLLLQGGPVGATIHVGDVLFILGEEGETVAPSHGAAAGAEPSTVRQEEPTPPARPSQPSSRPKAMPIVRKLAKERGIDLATITGTGPGGTITRADLDTAQTTARGSDRRADRVEPMSRIRTAIALHMTESWTTIPHVTVQADIRAEALLAARETDGATLPLEAVVASAVLPLLDRYPEFNAAVDRDQVVYKGRRDIGFAVDTDAGLLVVVTRDTDGMSTEQIAAEFARLADAAATGKLQPAEAVGQTFTISNIGSLGGGHGTPIIPMGTTAILSIGRARQAPVVEDGQPAVGLVAPIDLSYDHRLIDGGLGQRFLADLVEALETVDS